jgi:hypothetical protein
VPSLGVGGKVSAGDIGIGHDDSVDLGRLATNDRI